MLKLVDLEALNLRSQPIGMPSTRIGLLHLGQRVDELGPVADAPDWVRVRTQHDGDTTEGVLKAVIDGLPSLRDPESPEREALVEQAINQWLRFAKGQGKEHIAPFFGFVGEMWQAIGLNLDGRDRDTPWSAAAISFMVRNASATVPKYGQFKFAPAHHAYLHDSIVQRRNGNANAPYFGFRLEERRPQIGDIAGKWRETPREFEDAEAGNAFKSHSDIIVSVRPDTVLAIGGNVDHSVSISVLDKTPAGFLAERNDVFMLMANQT
jgi:hypothetical protein